MSTSTSVVQEESASMNVPIPLSAGYTAPPPTPMESMPATHPTHDFISVPTPLKSKSAADDETSLPCKSSNIASPPSKEDLDALAQYLLQQSLHSTPNLLSSPTLQRKRRSSVNIAAAIQPDNGIMCSTSVNVKNDIQTYSYSGGFCEESRKGIGKACQEVGAFYISVQDAEAALMMLRGGHGVDDESVVEGGLVPLSQLLTSTSQHHQHDVLDLDPLAFDAAVDTNFRHTMTKFAKLLFRISKDLLRFLLEDLSIENQSSIRGHSLKPLLYIHDINGKQELNLDDDVVLFISHEIDTHEGNKSALFLVSMGTQLQTWSQGKYKAPILKSLCKNGNGEVCNNGNGEVCIQFALIQHY